MPRIDYRQLRRQVSMAQVLGLIGFPVTSRRGHQLRGFCPIPACRSTSPRAFSVHLRRQVYRCFACRSHGNLLDLWAAVRGLPLHEAALDLCRAANLTPPRLPAPSLRQPHPVAFRDSSSNR
jgi:DNA primase